MNGGNDDARRGSARHEQVKNYEMVMSVKKLK